MFYRQTLLMAAVAAAVFGLGAAVLSLPGCGKAPENPGTSAAGIDTPADPTNRTAANGSPEATDNSTLPPARSVPVTGDAGGNAGLFAGWDKPAVALVFTGQQKGYIEPCGCTEGQSGGLSRRATLVEELRDKGWPVAGFDLGGTMRRQRRQSQIKFQTLLAGLKDMGYRGIGMGPAELKFGAGYVLSQNIVEVNNADKALTFLGANVVLFDSPDLQGAPSKLRVTTIGGRKIGAAAVLGKSMADKAFPGGPPADIKLLDAAESLGPVVDELKKQQTALNILLAYASTEESKALAKQFPEFDLIISAGGPEDPANEPIKIGNALLLHVGQKGKYVGVVGFYPDNAKQRLRYELVELKKGRFKDSMQMVEHMRFYQQQLKAERLAAAELPIPHPSGAEFVGAEKCGECHTTAYDVWKKTPHAHAFESLKHAREGDPEYGITRIYDAECLACHVTGWHPQQVLRYESGFINEEFASTPEEKLRSQLLQGQQCESCHGPGSKHVALAEAGVSENLTDTVRVSLKEAEQRVCQQCHDLDNSPHFDFKKYWPRVKHYGTD